MRRRVPLAGRVVAVTGAGRGIGRATSDHLLSRGARVALGDLEKPAVDGQFAVGVALDVTDRDSFRAFLAEAEAALGPLDVLVNNAGIMPIGPFLEESDTVTRRQVEVNVHGVVTGMKLTLPGMIDRGRGQVVNLGSAASLVGLPGEAVYCGTKFFVRGVSEAVRAELRGTGVEITVVEPNLAATRLGAGMEPARGSRLLDPEEVADAVVGAIERPRFEVSVPREIGPALRFRSLLPPRARDAVSRVLRMDKVAMDVRTEERADYEAEIARSPARLP
jgi:NADP-dependent 3-hydroxy acid dehydrogenase YdfG